MMLRNVVAVTGVTALLGLTAACTSSSSTPLTPTNPNTGGSSSSAADGSTLKASAPVPQSPVGGAKPESPATLRVSVASATYSTAALPPQYRFQVFNSANVMVENALVNSNSYAVAADLVVNQTYTWKARAELNGYVGPWSSTASFVAPETAFLGVSTFADPLTNGKTVGAQRGGQLVVGQGWRATTENDGIDYDLQSPCSDCILEFDATGFGKAEGEFLAKDLKWISMGDAGAFYSFGDFRNHPWKMHLEQRSDGDGSGMKLVWRNGDVGGGEPGDHDTKLGSAINWQENQVYHFKLEWDGGGYSVSVNGEEWFGGGWSQAYAPPAHRVSLGCWPRSETMFGTYRNVKLRKH
jgi:hypothetical protein